MGDLSVFYVKKRGVWRASIERRQVPVPKSVASKHTNADRAKALRWAVDEAARRGAGTQREFTVAELAERFLEAPLRAAPATRAEYSSHLALSILPAFGALTPVELTIPRLREWVRNLGTQVARQTCSNRLATLSRIVSWARAEGLTQAENHAGAREVRAELPEAPVRSVPVLLPGQVGDLLSCERVPAVRRMRVFVAAWAGLEAGTVNALRIGDLELRRGRETIRVERSAALKGPQGHATIKGPKNKHRHRTIPVHGALADALRWWLAEGRGRYLGQLAESTDLLFPSPLGKASRPKAGVQLRQDLGRAGVETPAGFAFKGLRACFATWLKRARVDESTRARLLGHAAKTTADRFYTGDVEGTLRAAVARLPWAALPEVRAWLRESPEAWLEPLPELGPGDVPHEAQNWLDPVPELGLVDRYARESFEAMERDYRRRVEQAICGRPAITGPTYSNLLVMPSMSMDRALYGFSIGEREPSGLRRIDPATLRIGASGAVEILPATLLDGPDPVGAVSHALGGEEPQNINAFSLMDQVAVSKRAGGSRGPQDHRPDLEERVSEPLDGFNEGTGAAGEGEKG